MKDEFGAEYETPTPAPCPECGSVRPHFSPGGYCVKMLKKQLQEATQAAQTLSEAIEDAQYIDNNWEEGHELEMQLGGLATQLLSILKGGYPLESENRGENGL